MYNKTQDFETANPNKTEIKAVQTVVAKDSLTENQIVHEVKVGETFAVLAQKYGITIEKLIIDNKIEPKPGQKIIITKSIKEDKSQRVRFLKMW
jgi:LysM repeat protein